MSWHTNAVLIRSDFSADYVGLFDRLGLPGGVAAGTVSFDDAASVSNEGVAAGTASGWTVLVGSFHLLTVDDKALAKIAKTCEVFQMVLEGISGTAGFTWRAARSFETGCARAVKWSRTRGSRCPRRKKLLPRATASRACCTCSRR
jgi:hypothetical protein